MGNDIIFSKLNMAQTDNLVFKGVFVENPVKNLSSYLTHRAFTLKLTESSF